MKHSMKFRSLLLASLRELALVAGPAVAQQKKPSSLIIWGDDISGFNVSAYNLGMMGVQDSEYRNRTRRNPMLNSRIAFNVVLVAVLLAAGICRAQQPAPSPSVPQASPAPQEAPAPVIQAEAIDALKQMGAYLHTLKDFSVTADITADEVLLSGQKIQVGGENTLTVRRPDRLKATVRKDETDIDREFYYDGKTFTIYGKKVKYYASAPAPPTIAALVDAVNERFDVSLPLADLFVWGTDKAPVQDITSALHIGPATIGGIPTDHYAFRQEGVDWQVWIQKGKTRLPRKLVITTMGEEGQPQYVSVLKWNLSPNISDKMFTFVPPKEAHRIVFAGQTADATK